MGEGETSRDRLKVGETGTIQIRTAQDAIDFASWCFESGYLPNHIKDIKQAFTIMQRGAEMGLPPFASWRYIYQTRGGKLALESKGALAVCQSKASFEDFEERIEGEGDGMRGVAVATRKGHKPTIKEFTMEDAKRAGLLQRPTNKQGNAYDGPWQAYLKDMLLSKARERALSICFAAELGGIPIEGLAEEIEARETQKAQAAQGLRARMHAIEGGQTKALPEGTASASMTDLIRGKDLVVEPIVVPEGAVISPDTVPGAMEEVISAQVDEALGSPAPVMGAAMLDDPELIKEQLEKNKKAAEGLEARDLSDATRGSTPILEGGERAPPVTTCQFKVAPNSLCSSEVVPGTELCSKHHFSDESGFGAALRKRGQDKPRPPAGQGEMFQPEDE